MVALLKNRDFELKGLPQSVWEPAYCKHNDDFYKMCLSIIESFADSRSEAETLSSCVRSLCHEYLALVINKELQPYQIGESEKRANEDDFRLLMKEETISLAKHGIPLYENERGEIKIDKDKLLEDS